MISHGRKLNKFGIPHPQVYGFGYKVADKGLITAFVEGWHKDTNSFHLPVGEMTVTLDDVSSILYILIVGQFPTYEALSYDEVKDLLIELLGVLETKANKELKESRGPQVRMSWLREVYEQCCIDGSWEYVVRAFLLYVLGCTIFANKSATWIFVDYLSLFRDLDMCGQWA